MDEYREGLFVIAVYVFMIVAFSLPPLIVYFAIRIRNIIKRADKILNYVEQSEEETRKYHD